MTIEFKPLNEALGAEVIGINVADDQSDETIAEIRDGWLRYNILLFRGQDLTVERQMVFARRFGELKKSQRRRSRITEHPGVSVFSNIKVDGEDIGGRPDRSFGDAWHSDNSFLKEPAGGSFFYAKEVPEKGGDDTWYANLTKAYDALPDDMKSKLVGLRWTLNNVERAKRHANSYKTTTKNQERKLPDVTHPFVRTHSETGQMVLFVGVLDPREASVNGMSNEEGVELLEELKAFATQPEFTYTHQWRPGDCILWDNRCTMHRGSNFPDSNGRRLCYRVTLEEGLPY
jgi:taurine dioxygenase